MWKLCSGGVRRVASVVGRANNHECVSFADYVLQRARLPPRFAINVYTYHVIVVVVVELASEHTGRRWHRSRHRYCRPCRFAFDAA